MLFPLKNIKSRNILSVRVGSPGESKESNADFAKNVAKQDSIPIGCVPPTFLVPAGGSAQPPVGRPSSPMQTPCTKTPWMQTSPPPDAGHVTCDAC